MNYTEFKKKYAGKKIDEDGVNGIQCVDLAKLYIEEVHGEKWRSMGGNGGAKEAYRLYPNSLIVEKENWILIKNSPTNYPEQGDLIIFDKTSNTGVGQYGHIAVYDRTLGNNSFVSLDQNVGNKEIQGVHHTFTAGAGFGKVLGWLHNTKNDKKENMTDEINKLQTDSKNMQIVINQNSVDISVLKKGLEDADELDTANGQIMHTQAERIEANKKAIANIVARFISPELYNKPSFEARSERMKAFLGMAQKGLIMAIPLLAMYGFNTDGLEGEISKVLAGLSAAFTGYLEWDKTKYKEAELDEVKENNEI